MPQRLKPITLTLEDWSDVVSALHWTQREILTEATQRAAFYRIERSINRQLGGDGPPPDQTVEVDERSRQ